MTYDKLERKLKQWHQDMNKERKHFVTTAKEVSKWDDQLRSNSKKIRHLRQNVDEVKREQDQLNTLLNGLQTKQDEITELLAKHIPAEDPPGRLVGYHDSDRDEVYQLAEDVNLDMNETCLKLQQLIEDINAANGAMSDTDEPMQQVTQLLQQHVDSLQEIEHATEKLKQKVEGLNVTRDGLRLGLGAGLYN